MIFVEKTMQLNVKPPFVWRTGLVAIATASALLSGCGSSSTVSTLVPTSMVVMGDGLADVGQVGGTVYSVKDATNGTWVQQVAASYGLSVTAQSAGGQGWARGNARVALKPDAAGSAATLTMTEQIDAFLAANSIVKDNVILLDPGISDLVVQAEAFKVGSISSAQVLVNAADAGKALAAQVRRLVAAGGTHIVVAGAYNLGKSPYAIAAGQAILLENASLKFNEALLVAMVDLGANVLYIDTAFRYNQVINQPATYSFSNSALAACTTPTAATCTPSTVLPAIDYNTYVFADDRYFTPAAQRNFGDYAYSRMKSRW
jgi:outer membrane lipase/esterase